MTLETENFITLYDQIVVTRIRETYTFPLTQQGQTHLVSGVTWKQAKDLDILGALLASLPEDEILWFQPDDPYTKNKPFDIDHIGLQGNAHYQLYVCGQKSKRICSKWERILSEFFGYPVELRWGQKEAL